MKREIITTSDGSTTIHLPDWNENYHSKHGAIQEAYHVFIDNGFSLFEAKPISILEIGFGTGLNAFITYIEAKKKHQFIHYIGVEAYPVSCDEALKMNFVEQIDKNQKAVFEKMHQSAWNKIVPISKDFTLVKREQFFQDINDKESFDLIYFDAFGFRVQPELWSELIFNKMYDAVKPGGILVTYACRTSIKNAMLQAGFKVEKLVGPPGKREMLRGYK